MWDVELVITHFTLHIKKLAWWRVFFLLIALSFSRRV